MTFDEGLASPELIRSTASDSPAEDSRNGDIFSLNSPTRTLG